MDTVFIQGLKATTTIGVYQHERKIKQTIIIDLEMSLDGTSIGSKNTIHLHNQLYHYMSNYKSAYNQGVL